MFTKTGLWPHSPNMSKEAETPAPTRPALFYERDFYPLSNFSAFSIIYQGQACMTSEHAYHMQKFPHMPHLQEMIRTCPSAHEAMHLAWRFKDRYRKEWQNERFRISVMEDVCSTKLHQHEYVRRVLRRTGGRPIIENSPKDSFWGWGPDKQGRNELGKIWMRLRQKLADDDAEGVYADDPKTDG